MLPSECHLRHGDQVSYSRHTWLSGNNHPRHVHAPHLLHGWFPKGYLFQTLQLNHTAQGLNDSNLKHCRNKVVEYDGSSGKSRPQNTGTDTGTSSWILLLPGKGPWAGLLSLPVSVLSQNWTEEVLSPPPFSSYQIWSGSRIQGSPWPGTSLPPVHLDEAE